MKRNVQIRCLNCNTWNILNLELGEIAYFNTKPCIKCSMNKYDAKSTKSEDNQ